MTTRVPSIPNLTDDNVQQVLSAAKEIIEVREGLRGDPLDKAVTFRDLEALQLVQQSDSAEVKVGTLPVQVLPAVNPTVFAPDNYDESADLSTPPAPFNLEATGGYSAIYLSWQYPPYRNHAYTEVYRSYANDLTTAVLIGSTPGTVFSDPVGTEVTAYYWVRNVSQGNVQSSYNSAGGAMAATAVDVARAIENVTADIESLPIFSTLASNIAELETANQTLINRTEVIEANSATLTDTLIAVDGQTKTALQIQSNVVAGLGGQYSVKIDANGHVAGFGLSNTLVNATPTSAFIVRADKFAIVDPASTSNNLTNTPSADSIPFAVSGGNTYIKAAFIQDATITNAKIQSVAADKITAGTITAAVDMRSPLIRSGAVSYGQAGFFLGNDGGTNKFYIGNGSTGVSGRELSFNGTDVTVRGTIFAYAGNISNVTANNITIYDNAGGILLQSGSGIRASDLLNSFVTLSGLGAGSFAFINQLTPANISTYIQSAAIGSALIANAAITNAKIGDLEVSTAKIQNAAITSLKINDLAVSTLKIAGNAVTVPTTVSTSVKENVVTGSYTTHITASIFMDTPGVLYASLTASLGFPNNPSESLHELLVNGVLLARLNTGVSFVQSVALSGGIFVGTGTMTVSYRSFGAPHPGQSGLVEVNDRTLFVQGAKR